MTSKKPPFRPIADSTNFPLLTAGRELPCGNLIACEQLVFMAPDDLSVARMVSGQEGTEWHLYGDTRWPAPAVWVEFCTSPGGFPGRCGVLVMNDEIPADAADPYAWIAKHGPLLWLFPHERSDAVIKQKAEMLRAQATSTENSPGPDDTQPRFIQSYCIYRDQDSDVRLVATYTDLLNSNGIPIQKYRMASLDRYDVDYCHYALNSLFHLNKARLAGMKFTAIPQFEELDPAFLAPEQEGPSWTQFHPTRILRARPALRALPTPDKLKDGIMFLEDYQRVMDVIRRETNLNMLAFEPPARRGVDFNADGNACMSAFIHRCNGGAIYVLPDRLLEEFDNTDCDEIRMSDLKLPFPIVFLKFSPPTPLFLAEGAPVDGCYIAKQGDEYLISVTAHWEDVDYANSLSVTCIDPTFSIHLPAPTFDLNQPGQNTEICVNAAVEEGINKFLAENAPPTDNISQTVERPDGTKFFVEDIRAERRKRRIEIFRSQEPVFRACLNIIVNAACFISFRPEDISEEWEGNPPEWLVKALSDPSNTRSARDRKQSAMRALATGDYVRIKVCGKNLFECLPTAGIGHGVSPRAHWRRGHWRRQRHGPGLSLMTPRWIRPTIVKKDSGTPVETRIYAVQEPPTEAGDN